MRLTLLRLLVAVTMVVGASVSALALPTAPPAQAAGVNEYSPAQWWPLRGSNLIGCTTQSGGPVCGGHHAVNAIDVEGPEGQAVYAAGSGKATVYSTSAACSGYGKTVVVDHGPHGKTLYSHLSGFSADLNANPGGVWVDENTVIGFVGHTGSVSGCSYNHLHLEYSSTGSWGSGASLIPDLQACVGSEKRIYPDYFGRSSWVGLAGHTFRAVNDGTGCSDIGRPTGSIDYAGGRLGGYAEVRGWALDPDDLDASTEVHVYVDGPAGTGSSGTVLRADNSRPDIDAAFPGAGPLHGYNGAVGGLSPGSHTLWVYAINVAGTPGNHLVLDTPTITVPGPTSGMPKGSVDSAVELADGTVRVAGWTFDPDAPTTATSVDVYVDNPAGTGPAPITIPADTSRPDIDAAFPGVGPLHGFDTAISGITPGSHTLWFYGANVAGTAGSPLLGTKTITVNGPLCAAGSLAGPFTDVDSAHPFCTDIAWMSAREIDSGHPDGSYSPTSSNTREMIALQLYNYAERPPFTPPATSPFPDVATSHPSYLEIAWLASTGLSNGFPDGTFGPTTSVSRQSMAAFFHRLAGGPTAPGPVPAFSDVPAGHPFDDEIAWLASTGVTVGYPDGTFGPTSRVTRQTMAAFLHRYAEL